VITGQLKATIRSTGYEVLEEREVVDRADSERDAREREVAALRRSVITAAIFTTPLVLLVMLTRLAPGLRFYKKGWPGLRQGHPDTRS
jgi:Cu+-exporting ATPase